MEKFRFLQIHTLCPHVGALLNRDDSGLAKRLPYGGVLRTRISSQCLKRHWRMADDANALSRIGEGSIRSRNLLNEVIIEARKTATNWSEEVADALDPWFQYAIYGSKTGDAPKERGAKSKFDDKKNRQTLLFGRPEIEWLGAEYGRLATEAAGDADQAFKAGKNWVDGKSKDKKEFLDNIRAMRERTSLPAGLIAALFGRMVTSDTGANMTAPVHVAHAFTVHAEEAESDYFTAVDDLSEDEPSADTIQETELTSGLFYGYVVVDLSGLMENLAGDSKLAGRVLHHLIYLIAEISPGAKLGSTAPYGRASFMLLEAGNRQPRSLAEAYRNPTNPKVDSAIDALHKHLGALDKIYATDEIRRVMSVAEAEIPSATPGTLEELANWAEGLTEAHKDATS